MAAQDKSRDRLAIHPTDPVAEAGRKIIARQTRRMLSQEAGSRQGADIEATHRMRVAIRRMRSLLKLIPEHYRPRARRELESGLRDIARALGRVRDLDVLLLDLQHYAASLPPDEKAQILSVISRLDRRRAKERERLKALFDSKSYARFLRQLKRFGKTSGKGARRLRRRSAPHQLRHILPVLLHQSLAQVKAYDAVLPAADIEVLHELRVEFKQLRYALEFFQPILGSSSGSYLRSVRAMQDYLGRVNDISVFTDTVSRLKKLSPAEAQSLERYRAARLAEREALREDFAALWRRFKSRATQREFSDALLVLR